MSDEHAPARPRSYIVLGDEETEAGLTPLPDVPLTKETLENMSEDDLMALDAFEVMSAAMEIEGNPGATGLLVLTTKIALARFLYEVDLSRIELPQNDPNFRHQIELFEKQAGLTPDGMLTMKEFSVLTSVSEKIGESPVYFISSAEISTFGNLVLVSGTWVIEGDQIAYPINKTDIICDKLSSDCELTNISVTVSEIAESGNSHNIGVDKDHYEIISWTDDSIIALDRGRCRTTTLTLNINANEVFETTSNLNKEGCEILPGILTLPALEKPRIARLMPSWEITYQFWQDRKVDLEKYYSPSFRSYAEQLKKLTEQAK